MLHQPCGAQAHSNKKQVLIGGWQRCVSLHNTRYFCTHTRHCSVLLFLCTNAKLLVDKGYWCIIHRNRTQSLTVRLTGMIEDEWFKRGQFVTISCYSHFLFLFFTEIFTFYLNIFSLSERCKQSVFFKLVLANTCWHQFIRPVAQFIESRTSIELLRSITISATDREPVLAGSCQIIL